MRLPSATALPFLRFSLLLSGCGDDGAVDSFDPGVDRCSSAADQAVYAMISVDPPDAGPGDQSDLAEAQNYCGRDVCLTEVLNVEDPPACMTDCLAADPDVGALSTGCLDCLAFSVYCGVEFCVTQCIEASSPGCVACVAENCEPTYHACLGFTP